MSLSIDEVLPEEPTGEIVHWMETGQGRSSPSASSAQISAAFLTGVVATLGGYLLVRYLAPRREGLPPWRWSRGPLH